MIKGVSVMNKKLRHTLCRSFGIASIEDIDVFAYFAFLSNFAHVSFKLTVKLKTGFSGVESGSTQK